MLVCVRDPKPLWLELVPAVAPPISVGVALFAVYAAHALSARRQRRDELFKLCQAARDLSNEVAADASAAWGSPGSDLDAQRTASEVVGKLGRLGRQLEMLRGRSARFELGGRLIAFRQAVTIDLKDPDRGPAPDRAGEVLAAAGELETAIDRAFRALHG